MAKVIVGILIGALLTSTALYLFNVFSKQSLSLSTSTPKKTVQNTPIPTPSLIPSPVPFEVTDYNSFVAYIKNLGLDLSSANKAYSDIYSGNITEVKIDSNLTYVIEYASEMEALQKAAEISPDASFLQKTLPDGSKQIVNFTKSEIPTHYYKKGRIIVIYAGTNDSMVKTLEKAFDTQFAGHN